jgi:hypothetical protein
MPTPEELADNELHVLFLVDRLGAYAPRVPHLAPRQMLRLKFQQAIYPASYSKGAAVTPDDGRKFTELYNVLANAEKEKISPQRLSEMESACLNALRQFEKRKLNANRVVETLLKYDELLLRDFDGNHHKEKYEATLRARPWENCGCEI